MSVTASNSNFEILTCERENGTGGLSTEDDSGEGYEKLELGVFMIRNAIATIPVDC
jgi:hypothetical protein